MNRAVYTASLAAVIVACLAMIQSTVVASSPHPVKQLTAATTLIAAGTTLASTRSVAITNNDQGNQAYGLAIIYVAVTDADDSETGVTVSCTGQRPGATYDYRIPACPFDTTNVRYNCESGAMLWNPSDDTETATNVKAQTFRVDIEGLINVDCSFAFTGGSASDTIQVDVDLATKG